ncbi:MAG: hypothetical protein ACJA08_000257 [Cyclobacteriaceae bacterium]|jgi:uncharacterized protein (DUF2384 family)
MELNLGMKKYQESSSLQNQVNEPLAAYVPSVSQQIGMLANLKANELQGAHLPGQTLSMLQKETSLNPQALASVVGVSKSKYYDLIKVKDLSVKNIDALADFATLWQKGIEAFDGSQELLNEWLEIRNENLGGIKPIALLSSRIGRRELERAFLRIEHSIYG